MCKGNEKMMRSAHAGFSLIAVLIIALIGMALIGVTFYIYESSTGQASITMQRSLEYNALQDGLEQGKSLLVSLCNSKDIVPRWTKNASYTSGMQITNPDQLILDNGKIPEHDVPVGGRKGKLRVDILDADYDETAVNEAAVLPRAELMPPSVRITEDGPAVYNDAIGSYLIRATLTINGETKIMETLVFQRNLAESISGGGSGGGGEDDMNP